MLGLIAAQPQPFPATCSRMHDGDLVEEGRGGGNWYSSALRSGWPEQQQQELAVLQLPAGSGAEEGEVPQPWTHQLTLSGLSLMLSPGLRQNSSVWFLLIPFGMPAAGGPWLHGGKQGSLSHSLSAELPY